MLLFFLCEFVGEAFDLAGLQARLGSTNRAQDPLEPRLASDLQPIGRLKVASGWRSDRLTSFLLAMITRRALPSWSAEPHTDETAVTSLSFLASVLAGPRCLVARRDNARTVTLRHLERFSHRCGDAIAAVPHVVRAFCRGEKRKRGRDQVADLFETARPCGSQPRFQLGKGLLDRIEIGTVGRQKAELGARGLNGRVNLWLPMDRQVVEDDDIATPQGGP